MKFVRIDRKGRKGGRCLLYYEEHLQATHRKHLFIRKTDTEWLQVKFPSIVFGDLSTTRCQRRILRKNRCHLQKCLAKNVKHSFTRGFNCYFQRDSALKLRCTFEMYNNQNIVNVNTRETQTTSTLIALIVTTRSDLISKCRVFPLGISDHNLVHATMKLKNKRPPSKYIRKRDYTNLNVENLRQDIESVPFHVASVFDEPDDVFLA